MASDTEKPKRKDRGVCQRPDRPGWWVRIYHSGRTTWYRCDSKSQATALYGRLKADIREGRYFPDKIKAHHSEPVPILFRDYVKTWLESQPLKGKKISTIETYRHRLSKHILPAFSTVRLAEIGRPKIKTWVAGLVASGLDYDSASGMLLTLSAVLTEAVEDEVIEVNPALRAGKILKRPNVLVDRNN